MDSTANATVSSPEQDLAHATQVKIYMRVFWALLVLTLGEYFYAYWFADVGFLLLVLGLVGMAIVKASLVGIYFMHLNFEGRWKYLVLLPTAFLMCVLVLALYPDIAMPPVDPDLDPREAFSAAPLEPGPSLAYNN